MEEEIKKLKEQTLFLSQQNTLLYCIVQQLCNNTNLSNNNYLAFCLEELRKLRG